MTITDILPSGQQGGEYRADFITGLVDVYAFIATHDGAPLFTPLLEVPVPQGPRGARVLALDDIAARLGVEVTPDGHGGLTARREFGPLVIEAHLPAEDEAPVDDEYLRTVFAVVREDGRGAAA